MNFWEGHEDRAQAANTVTPSFFHVEAFQVAFRLADMYQPLLDWPDPSLLRETPLNSGFNIEARVPPALHRSMFDPYPGVKRVQNPMRVLYLEIPSFCFGKFE